MIHPTIHINGTSKNELLEQWNNAYGALIDARRALTNAAPNGRDYYPQGLSAITTAVAEHEARVFKIDSILNEIENLRERATGAGQ